MPGSVALTRARPPEAACRPGRGRDVTRGSRNGVYLDGPVAAGLPNTTDWPQPVHRRAQRGSAGNGYRRSSMPRPSSSTCSSSSTRAPCAPRWNVAELGPKPRPSSGPHCQPRTGLAVVPRGSRTSSFCSLAVPRRVTVRQAASIRAAERSPTSDRPRRGVAAGCGAGIGPPPGHCRGRWLRTSLAPRSNAWH